MAKLLVTARAADATGLPDHRAITKQELRRPDDLRVAAKALERRGDWLAQRQVKGCRGYSSALEPPTSDGPYDMVFVYNCR